MTTSSCLRLPLCGAFPYVPAEQAGLRQRGLLKPNVWAAVHILAVDPRATVTPIPRSRHRRVEVVSRNITIVVVDYRGSGLPVVLTAFVAGDPTDHGRAVLAAAGVVDRDSTVDLDERLWGFA